MLKKILSLCAALVLTAACASATPTSAVSTVNWNAYTDPSGVGFYLYWRSDVPTSAYSNTSRIQITSITAVTEAIATAVPTPHSSSLCFVLTAYDAAGNESAYSNEACGYTGFPGPAGTNLK